MPRTIVTFLFGLRNDILGLSEESLRCSSLAYMRTTAAKCADASATRAPETVFCNLGFGEGTYAEKTGVYAAVGGVEEHGT